MLKLPIITYPITVDTIGKAYMLDSGIRASCPQCGSSCYLDLVELIERRGHDWPIDLVSACCPACGLPARPALARQAWRARRAGKILYPAPPRDGVDEMWESAYRRYRQQRIAAAGSAAAPP